MANRSVFTAILAVTASIASYSVSNATMLAASKEAHSANNRATNIIKVHDRYQKHYHDSYGRSRPRKSVDQVKFKLEKRGYKKIRILDNQSPIYLFKACRDGVKYKFAIRDTGAIKYRNKTGYCSRRRHREADSYNGHDRRYNDRRYHDDGISPSKALRIVGQHGYGRAYFVDRQLPVYKLNACRGGTRYKVSVNGYGKITRSQRIGYCSTGSRYIDYWRSPRRFR